MSKVVVMAGKITKEKREVRELTPDGELKVTCEYNVTAKAERVLAEVTPIRAVVEEEEVCDVDTSFFDYVNAKAMEERMHRQAVYEANVARQLAQAQQRKRRKKKPTLLQIAVKLFK